MGKDKKNAKAGKNQGQLNPFSALSDVSPQKQKQQSNGSPSAMPAFVPLPPPSSASSPAPPLPPQSHDPSPSSSSSVMDISSLEELNPRHGFKSIESSQVYSGSLYICDVRPDVHQIQLGDQCGIFHLHAENCRAAFNSEGFPQPSLKAGVPVVAEFMLLSESQSAPKSASSSSAKQPSSTKRNGSSSSSSSLSHEQLEQVVGRSNSWQPTAVLRALRVVNPSERLLFGFPRCAIVAASVIPIDLPNNRIFALSFRQSRSLLRLCAILQRVFSQSEQPSMRQLEQLIVSLDFSGMSKSELTSLSSCDSIAKLRAISSAAASILESLPKHQSDTRFNSPFMNYVRESALQYIQQSPTPIPEKTPDMWSFAHAIPDVIRGEDEDLLDTAIRGLKTSPSWSSTKLERDTPSWGPPLLCDWDPTLSSSSSVPVDPLTLEDPAHPSASLKVICFPYFCPSASELHRPSSSSSAQNSLPTWAVLSPDISAYASAVWMSIDAASHMLPSHLHKAIQKAIIARSKLSELLSKGSGAASPPVVPIVMSSGSTRPSTFIPRSLPLRVSSVSPAAATAAAAASSIPPMQMQSSSSSSASSSQSSSPHILPAIPPSLPPQFLAIPPPPSFPPIQQLPPPSLPPSFAAAASSSSSPVPSFASLSSLSSASSLPPPSQSHSPSPSPTPSTPKKQSQQQLLPSPSKASAQQPQSAPPAAPLPYANVSRTPTGTGRGLVQHVIRFSVERSDSHYLRGCLGLGSSRLKELSKELVIEKLHFEPQSDDPKIIRVSFLAPPDMTEEKLLSTKSIIYGIMSGIRVYEIEIPKRLLAPLVGQRGSSIEPMKTESLCHIYIENYCVFIAGTKEETTRGLRTLADRLYTLCTNSLSGEFGDNWTDICSTVMQALPNVMPVLDEPDVAFAELKMFAESMLDVNQPVAAMQCYQMCIDEAKKSGYSDFDPSSFAEVCKAQADLQRSRNMWPEAFASLREWINALQMAQEDKALVQALKSTILLAVNTLKTAASSGAKVHEVASILLDSTAHLLDIAIISGGVSDMIVSEVLRGLIDAAKKLFPVAAMQKQIEMQIPGFRDIQARLRDLLRRTFAQLKNNSSLIVKPQLEMCFLCWDRGDKASAREYGSEYLRLAQYLPNSERSQSDERRIRTEILTL